MSGGSTKGRGLLLLAVILVAGVLPRVQAETNAPSPATQLALQEKEACKRNLERINKAIQAYELDHKDLPNWLSDLVPQYLDDATVLICPVCRRTGKTEEAALSDPKLPSSYLFEFCPLPLGSAAPNVPNRTRREWKRRQMGLLGSEVPMVRCRQHGVALNLAFDGHIYESPGMWEQAFTNRVSLAALSASNLFAGEVAPAAKPAHPGRFPGRDPKAKPGQLDLTHFYNAELKESWLGKSDSDLAMLPHGLQTFAGVSFDVRGVVQLNGKGLAEKKFPTQVKAIPVHQKCKRLHFLHAAGGASPRDDGQQVGSYFIHFAGNPARLEIPIFYGRDLREVHPLAGEPPPPKVLRLAWSSEPNDEKAKDHPCRLFLTTWNNLAPEAEIESIDFVSSLANPAPFLVAITAD